jgi:hypothetical protein
MRFRGPKALAGVAVEKLLPAKFAKIKLHQDALQTTFSVFLDIFYPQIFGYFEENGLFQHPRLISTINTACAKLALKWRLLTLGTSTEGDEIWRGSPSSDVPPFAVPIVM